MKKRLLALFLAFVMAMSLLPVSVFADGGTGGQLQGTKDDPITASEDGVTVNKYVSGDAENGYSLTLEAYAENKVTSTTTTTPLDIVLVLDTSGSMADRFDGLPAIWSESRIHALKTAVKSFIDKVAANAVETETNHQIGIVKFATNASTVCSLTSASSGQGDLKDAVDDLGANGATRADYGMAEAKKVLQGAQPNSEKVVIMFTDGEPTSGSRYEEEVAHGAINTAKDLKADEVTVYTIGIFSGADPSNISGQTNKYMNAVSSNYPNAESQKHQEWWGTDYTIDLGTRAEGKYYFASKNAEGLEDVFDTIANTVTQSTLKVNPDEEAVLSDTLSDYFNFPEGLAEGSYADVTVQKVPVTGKNGRTYTWGDAEAVPGANVTVTGDKIEVTGFNYKENAVTEKTENGNTTYGGCKLVVTFPIEVDENACLETPVPTGVYSTNSTAAGSRAGLSYKSGDSVDSNDDSLTLSDSPAVHLTDLDGNGTDVKVQVYVDGKLVTDPLSYITLTRDSGDTAYDYVKTTVEGGTINCDFNYDPDHSHGDCIDLLVTVKNDTYVLQGVRSYQDHGMSGTDNVRNSGNNKYVIDNVTAVGNTEDVDCTIYLRTKYSVEYYQGSDELTEAPYNDSNVYVAEENITATTPNGPEKGQAQWMDWKNDNCKTSVNLPALPTVEGYDVSGWYLGSATNTGTTYTGPFNVINEESDKAGGDTDDNIIKFYATTALKSYDITINYVDGENQPLKTAYTESKNSGEEYSFDVSSDTTGTIPFIIDKGETQYVFNQIKSGSSPLEGTVAGAVSITAEYLLDSDKDGTPDKYEATVTYRVVNGTWSDGATDDKTENFILKEFDEDSNSWVDVETPPTLGETIPTGMQPDATHIADGASWNENITADTVVTVSKTYTYTFGTTATTGLKVNKTLKVKGIDYVAGNKVEVGDVLTYTIKVTNTGNVSLSGIAVTDTFTGSAAPTTETVGVTWNLNAETGKYEATWNVGELAAGTDATLTYTYTVQAADQGKTITNNAVAKSGTTEDGDNNTVDVYNPGLKVNKAVTKVNDTVVAAGETVVVQKDDVLTYTITVKNTGDQDLTNVVVTDTKWSNGTKITVSGVDDPVTLTSGSYTISSLAEDAIVTITYTYKVTDADVTVGKVTNNVSVTSDETPGGEDGGTTTDVVGDVTVQPADITIYTGGDGYTGAVNGSNGDSLGITSGLPEPGFYINLPTALDTALKKAAGHTGTGPLDLSGHVTFTASTGSGEPRKWTLARYDNHEGNDSVAFDKYIYRLVPANAQEPIRMQFTKDGQTATSDDFEIDLNTLHDEYVMDIYAGSVNTATVEIQITFGSKTYAYTTTSVPGNLIVRGTVNGGDTTADIVPPDNLPVSGNQFAAATGTDTKYYINGSQLEVKDPTKVELLVDGIVENGKTELKDYVLANLDTVESLKGLSGVVDSNSKFAFQYLDLVDTSNGNVWIRPSGNMTIFWPYPADADTNGEFHVIHFDGLDRNYDNLNTALSNNAPKVLTAEKKDGGIVFTTSSFSPFAVVYDAKVTEYTIDASAGANGSIDPVGSVTVAAGADKTFTITADAGYHISDVTVDGKSVGAVSSYTFEDVMTNHTIRATFAKNSNPTSYTLYYHSNFGEDVTFYQSSSTRSVTVKEYDDVGRLPERDGYVFVSWNTEPDGSGTRYMPGDAFRIDGSSDDLYAQWQKDKTGPDDSGVSNWLETDEHNAYLSGYPDSTFRADRNMTRAEVAQMFYALLLDKNVTITKSFSDVPDDAWYATAVKTLASLGMMDGYPDGTFRPDEPITRAEFATVGLAFAYDPLDASCSYYDVGANAWYYTYVAQATTYGWIGGYPDNTFRPGNNITRVEVCVIVNNMLGRDADERYIDRNEDELVHFVDLSDSYWGYYTIMESTNTHEYTGSFTNEKWTDVK